MLRRDIHRIEWWRGSHFISIRRMRTVLEFSCSLRTVLISLDFILVPFQRTSYICLLDIQKPLKFKVVWIIMCLLRLFYPINLFTTIFNIFIVFDIVLAPSHFGISTRMLSLKLALFCILAGIKLRLSLVILAFPSFVKRLKFIQFWIFFDRPFAVISLRNSVIYDQFGSIFLSRIGRLLLSRQLFDIFG